MKKSIKSMPSLPSMPSSKRGGRELSACSCGCGAMGPGDFRPGHDSYLKAWALRVRRGVVKLADIPHDGLRAQVRKALDGHFPNLLPREEPVVETKVG